MNLGTLVATLTVETAGLRRGIIDFGMLEKKILASSNKMVRQLGTVNAAVKRLDKNVNLMATSTAMSVWEKKMLATTNKMVRQLGRVTNQTRMLKKELLSLQGVGRVTGVGVMGGGAISAGKNMPDPNKLANTWGDNLGRMSMRLRSFGWLATTVFTAPLIMGATAISKFGRDFEMAMAKIEGLVGIAKSQTEAWGKSLLNMAKATSKGPQELADTLYYVASSGFKSAQALEITEMAAKGAATGLGETGDVANFLTSAMNAYRSSGLTAARAMDVLTASVREGKGEPAEMARALGTILPIAAELGVSLDQVGGALASMTLITSQTANAATYLRNVLMKLMHPSAGTEKAFARMGTSTKELNDMLRRQGLMPTLLRLRELTDEYGESMAEIFPNIRALLGALNLTGQNLMYNKQVMEAVTQSMGDFEKAFFIASQTIAFRWNTALVGMKVNLIKLGVVIAQLILPILEKWSQKLQNVIEWFTNLNKGTQRMIVQLGKWLVLIGPMALIFSTFGMAIGFVADKFKKLAGGMASVGRFLITNPWLLLATAIVAATVAIVRHVRAQKEFKDVVGNVNSLVAEEITKLTYVFNRAKKAAEGTTDRANAIRVINERYGVYLKNLLTEKSSLEDIEEVQRQVTNAMVAAATVRGSEQELSSVYGKISNKFRTEMGAITDAFTERYGGDMLGEFVQDMYDTADKVLKTEGGKIKTDLYLVSQDTWRAVHDLWEEYVLEMSRSTGMLRYDWEEFGKAFLKFAAYKGMASGPINMLNAMISANQEAVDSQKELEESMSSIYAKIDTPAIRQVLMDMAAMDRIYNATKEDMDEQGKEYDVITDKTNLYNAALVKLKALGLEEAGEWIKHVEGLLHSLSTETGDTGSRVDELTKIMGEFNNKMQTLKDINADSAMKDQFEEYGKVFDFVGEKADLLSSTITELMENGFFKDEFTQKLIKEFKDLPKNMGPAIIILAKLGSKLEALKNQREHMEQFGKYGETFDFVGEKAKLLESAITELMENGFFEEEFVQGLIEEFKNLPPSILSFIQVLDKLREALEVAQVKAKFEGPKFDVIGAEISAYESAIDGIIEAMSKMENLKTATFTIEVEGVQQTISLVAYLNLTLREFYNKLDMLKMAQQTAIDQEMINLLQAEADAFGGVIGKVNVLTYALEAQEKQLRSMLKANATKKAFTPEEIQNTINNINTLKYAIEDLNAAIDIKYLQDMNNLFGNLSTSMALLDGYMAVMEDQLKAMSANGMEATDEFRNLASQLQKYKNTIMVVEEFTGAMDGMIRTLIEGGDETQSLGEKMSEYLSDTLKDIIAKLISATLRFVIFTNVIKGFKLEQGSFGKSLADAFDIGKSGLKLMDFSGVLKTGGIEDFTDVVNNLKDSLGELSKIFDEVSKGQVLNTGVVEKGTEALSFAEVVYNALTKAKKGEAVATAAVTVADQVSIGVKAKGMAVAGTQVIVEKALTIQKEKSAFATFLLAGAEALLKGVRSLGLAGIIAGALFAVAAIAMVTMAVRKAKKMDKGGIIPPGYPNDTYPALLTSGEAVIPLDQMEKQTWSLEGAEVRFEIEGDRLVGILKKQMKKKSIY